MSQGFFALLKVYPSILMNIDRTKVELKPIPKLSKLKRIGARKSWIISQKLFKISFDMPFNIYLQNHFWKEKTFWGDGYLPYSVSYVSKEVIQKYIQEQG